MSNKIIKSDTHMDILVTWDKMFKVYRFNAITENGLALSFKFNKVKMKVFTVAKSMFEVVYELGLSTGLTISVESMPESMTNEKLNRSGFIVEYGEKQPLTYREYLDRFGDNYFTELDETETIDELALYEGAEQYVNDRADLFPEFNELTSEPVTELPMKAYLIRTSFVTRVEVPTDYNEDAILAAANAKMIQTISDDGIFEHVEEIVEDTECPTESEPEQANMIQDLKNIGNGLYSNTPFYYAKSDSTGVMLIHFWNEYGVHLHSLAPDWVLVDLNNLKIATSITGLEVIRNNWVRKFNNIAFKLSKSMDLPVFKNGNLYSKTKWELARIIGYYPFNAKSKILAAYPL